MFRGNQLTLDLILSMTRSYIVFLNSNPECFIFRAFKSKNDEVPHRDKNIPRNSARFEIHKDPKVEKNDVFLVVHLKDEKDDIWIKMSPEEAQEWLDFLSRPLWWNSLAALLDGMTSTLDTLVKKVDGMEKTIDTLSLEVAALKHKIT
eukprot:TRINITY_DN21520_c0_g1_i1.p1 TRINITY_DN21520_c0_g1~~TRINITY_DN21520_c0_g1_i1.p1  ORF type:complete len:157 (+),score=21.49 TRINITY_DN21520_c0_g1_i1:29-472(+)